MINHTSKQFDTAIADCKDIFLKKLKDYGSAWRVLRVSSITDQIFIKAQRIRNIDEKGVQKVEDGITGEFIGIINYAVIGLIQLELEQKDGITNPDQRTTNPDQRMDIPQQEVETLYNKHIQNAKSLMLDKNHDYDEAWRKMRISSFTDLILMKLLRVKQIEDNSRQTIISEGIAANYYDMINYAVFALIKIEENKSN